jgi:hypothetical protein
LAQRAPLSAALEALLTNHQTATAELAAPALSQPFERLIQVTRATPEQRSRVLHTLLWRVGPRLDRLALRWPDLGDTERSLDQAGKALQRLAAMPGYLSSDASARRLLDVLRERIASAQRLLERWSPTTQPVNVC